MIIIPSSGTLQGQAGTAGAVSVTISSDSISAGVDTFQSTQPAQLGTSAGTLLTAGGAAQVLISDIHLSNTTLFAVNNVKLFIGGSAASNQICSFNIPASGEAVYTNNGWVVYDSNGGILPAVTASAKNYASRVYARNRWL